MGLLQFLMLSDVLLKESVGAVRRRIAFASEVDDVEDHFYAFDGIGNSLVPLFIFGITFYLKIDSDYGNLPLFGYFKEHGINILIKEHKGINCAVLCKEHITGSSAVN